MTGGEPARPDGSDARLRAELHPLAEEILRAAQAGSTGVALSVPGARARVAAIGRRALPGPATVAVAEVVFAAPRGPVRARHYVPPGEPLGSIVFLHGGGWVTGDLETSDAACRVLAVESGCDVLNVDYALAPEFPYPHALDDVMAAVDWLEQRVEARPLVVAGESAGANLAAVVAQRLRSSGLPNPVMQVLAYPVMDARTDSASYLAYGDGGSSLTAAAMRWYLDHYAGPEVDRSSPELSPLRSPELGLLPPTHVVIAEHDPLRDEGFEYARLLRLAGVPVSIDYHSDMFHGFWTYFGVLPPAEPSLLRAGLAIRDCLESQRSVSASIDTSGLTDVL